MHPIDKTFEGAHTETVHCTGPEHSPVRFRNSRPGQSLSKLQPIPSAEESLLELGSSYDCVLVLVMTFMKPFDLRTTFVFQHP